MGRTKEILSIGYQGDTVEGVVEKLRRARVSRVIDIRLMPISRRKGFSKTALSSALGRSGIEYVHLRDAGNPFYKEKKDVEGCLAKYEEHLESHPEVVDEVSHAVSDRRTALLCYEADPCTCHRSILIRALLAESPDKRVRHL